MNHQLDKLVD